VAILGPTASGKSDLAFEVAKSNNGEIVSVDSMQVYRGLDIGTAKPTAASSGTVPHHLIDVVDPEVTFTVAEHQRLGRAAMADVDHRARLPVIVGGSGLHFRALVDPLEFPPTDAAVRRAIQLLGAEEAVVELLAADPGAGAHVDLANPRRAARSLEIFRITGETPTKRAASAQARDVRLYKSRFPMLAFGVDAGDELAARVAARFDTMLGEGLLDEVAGLVDRLGATASQGVGYKELVPVVRGEKALDEGRDDAIRATLALAKRQRTFFRRDHRICWIPWHDGLDQAVAAISTAIREATWTS